MSGRSWADDLRWPFSFYPSAIPQKNIDSFFGCVIIKLIQVIGGGWPVKGQREEPG